MQRAFTNTPLHKDQVHALKYCRKKLFGLLNPTSCIVTPCLFASRHSMSWGWAQDGAHRHPAILEMHHCRAQCCTPWWLAAWAGCCAWLLGLSTQAQGCLQHPQYLRGSGLVCIYLRNPVLPWETSAIPVTQTFQARAPKSFAQPYLDCTLILSVKITRNLKKKPWKKSFPWLQEEPCVNKSTRHVNSRLRTQCLFFISNKSVLSGEGGWAQTFTQPLLISQFLLCILNCLKAT